MKRRNHRLEKRPSLISSDCDVFDESCERSHSSSFPEFMPGMIVVFHCKLFLQCWAGVDFRGKFKPQKFQISKSKLFIHSNLHPSLCHVTLTYRSIFFRNFFHIILCISISGNLVMFSFTTKWRIVYHRVDKLESTQRVQTSTKDERNFFWISPLYVQTELLWPGPAEPTSNYFF